MNTEEEKAFGQRKENSMPHPKKKSPLLREETISIQHV